MIILLDTSTPVCRLAIVDGDLTQQFDWTADRQLARGLLKFLDQKTGGIDKITAIGVMKGPGSFTGLRIGLSVANTLADGLNIPIVGESGQDWQQKSLTRLVDGDNDRIVLPLYDRAANITKPRK